MAKLNIQTGAENPCLRQKAKTIEQIDKNIKKLAKDMVEVMDEQNGAGLAAPQVGQSLRMIVVGLFRGPRKFRDLALVNPRIISSSTEVCVEEEGCLSLPGVFAPVARCRQVVVGYQNLRGKEMIAEFSDINARVVQHEIDHLDGILFIDLIKDAA